MKKSKNSKIVIEVCCFFFIFSQKLFVIFCLLSTYQNMSGILKLQLLPATRRVEKYKVQSTKSPLLPLISLNSLNSLDSSTLRVVERKALRVPNRITPPMKRSDWGSRGIVNKLVVNRRYLSTIVNRWFTIVNSPLLYLCRTRKA